MGARNAPHLQMRREMPRREKDLPRAQSWEVVRQELKSQNVVHILIQTPSCQSSVPSSHCKIIRMIHTQVLPGHMWKVFFPSPYTISSQGTLMNWYLALACSPLARRQLGGSSCRKPCKLTAASTRRIANSSYGAMDKH